MLRGFASGLIITLAIALAYGVLYAVIELTWGLIAVAVLGGWLIGSGIRRGVTAALLRRGPDREPSADESDHRRWPRGTAVIGALLGALAWLLGTYVAFAIIQLVEGVGPLLERLSLANFAAFFSAITASPLLQAAILAAFVVVAAYTARAPAPTSAPDKRR